MLVNSEPGPSVIRSASAIAVSAAGSGFASRGRSRIDWMRCRLRLIRVSPVRIEPSASVASSDTFAVVLG